MFTKVREAILFIAGLIGFVHEVFISDSDRKGLIVAFLSMMGVPFARRIDRYRQCKTQTDSIDSKDKEEV